MIIARSESSISPYSSEIQAPATKREGRTECTDQLCSGDRSACTAMFNPAHSPGLAAVPPCSNGKELLQRHPALHQDTQKASTPRAHRCGTLHEEGDLQDTQPGLQVVVIRCGLCCSLRTANCVLLSNQRLLRQFSPFILPSQTHLI